MDAIGLIAAGAEMFIATAKRMGLGRAKTPWRKALMYSRGVMWPHIATRPPPALGSSVRHLTQAAERMPLLIDPAAAQGWPG